MIYGFLKTHLWWLFENITNSEHRGHDARTMLGNMLHGVEQWIHISKGQLKPANDVNLKLRVFNIICVTCGMYLSSLFPTMVTLRQVLIFWLIHWEYTVPGKLPLTLIGIIMTYNTRLKVHKIKGFLKGRLEVCKTKICENKSQKSFMTPKVCEPKTEKRFHRPTKFSKVSQKYRTALGKVMPVLHYLPSF